MRERERERDNRVEGRQLEDGDEEEEAVRQV